MPINRYAGSRVVRRMAPGRVAIAVTAYCAFILSFTFTAAMVFGLMP